MGARDYERLEIEPFGDHLLTSGDLDPVYIALVGSGFSNAARSRFLIAYWCLYHVGAACYVAEREDSLFWATLYTATVNNHLAPTGGRWPRGHERRHFRGKQGERAVDELSRRYRHPEDMVERLLLDGAGGRPFAELKSAVETHRGFGPWMAFKIADMLDRCIPGFTVDFTQAQVFMFQDPVKAALRFYRRRHGLEEGEAVADPAEVIAEVVDYLVACFERHLAPPLRDRPVGLQEVETVLCKWKSHLNGHYPLWNDTDEINAGLEEWGPHSRLARAFARAMPRRST